MAHQSEPSKPKVHQPLHPSVVPRLDPEYVKFHNEVVAYIIPPHTLPWTPELRNAPAVPGGSAPLEVGKIADYDLADVGGKAKVRTYTPEGDAPKAGWPVFLFFHGGAHFFLYF